MNTMLTNKALAWNDKRIPQKVTIESLQLRQRLNKEEAHEVHLAIQKLVYTKMAETAYTDQERIAKLANLVKEIFDVWFVGIGTLYLFNLNSYDIELMFDMCANSNDSKPTAKLKVGEKGGQR